MQRSRTAIWLIREPRASSLVELMLVCAVSAILVTRAYLALTGYPQVGGETLHIAHMLWGGLLMLIAALIFFQAADRIWKPCIAILFGAGFGLFIDEVGKFVTRDNDYFFKPTVAIIYVIFILILLSTHFIGRIDKKTREEHLYYAAEILSRSWVAPITELEKASALKNIALSGLRSQEVTSLKRSIQQLKTLDEGGGGLWQTWDAFLQRIQMMLAGRRFQVLIYIAIIVHVASYVSVVLFMQELSLPNSFSEWLDLSWQVAVGLLLIAGTVFWMQNKRLQALKLFYIAMLVMLLIGQIFIFADSQFHGLIELTINTAILIGLHGTIEGQTNKKQMAETRQQLTA